MKWVQLFSCGKINKKADRFKPAQRTITGFVSEATCAGDSPGESHFYDPQAKSDNSEITVNVKKESGSILGLRLFHNSQQIQSIEKSSALASFMMQIPIGASIRSVNGTQADVSTVKGLLRDCRDRTMVSLVISTDSIGGRHLASSKRQSQCSSAVSSGNPLSPSPSQLSSMWRRVSETGSLPVSGDGRVVPIDFSKLTRDSMGMWTRNGSLPDPRTDYDSPITRKSRTSCEGIYTNRIIH